jgi:hypothetical protein
MAAGDVRGYLKGAYDSQVQLSTGEILTLEEYIKRTVDDEEALTIAGIVSGSYDAMLALSDGSTKLLSEHVRSPGALSITGVLGGSYEAQVNLEGSGIVTTAQKVILDKAAAAVIAEEIPAINLYSPADPGAIEQKIKAGIAGK